MCRIELAFAKYNYYEEENSFLLVILLLQNCVVYQKVPVSITQAHNKGPVLIKDGLNNKTKALYIEKINDKYYIPYRVWEKGEDGNHHWFEVGKQLDADAIKIYLKDKKKSTARTIIFVALTPFIAIGIFVAFLFANNFIFI